MGQPVIKLGCAERELYLSARSVKSRFISGDAFLTVIKRMRRMNEMEYNMQHAISALRSAALNEDRDKDDPLSFFMNVQNSAPNTGYPAP